MTGAGHSHGPGGHTAAAAERRGARYLIGALALILGFMAVEVVVGILASSLALISDAGHMLTDAAAIALALIAARLAARPARGNLTYGLKQSKSFPPRPTASRSGCSVPGFCTRPCVGSLTRRRLLVGSF
jgi:Co/Zn/Cd efflux system component